MTCRVEKEEADCAAETQSRNYGNALSLLKHCDVSTLQKLCGTLTSSDDSTVVYANFPKRSLVKCFSARDKYDWHIAQTAELECLTKKWEAMEQQRKRRGAARRKARLSSTKQGNVESRVPGMKRDSYVTYDTNVNSEVHLNDIRGSIPQSSTVRRSSSKYTTQPTTRKTSLSPLVVNEDVLQEALAVAENFHMSEDSDLPSPLSSCLKTQSDTSESDVDSHERTKPRQTSHHEVQYTRNMSTASSAFGSFNRRHMESSHIFPNTTPRANLPTPERMNKKAVRGKSSFSTPPTKPMKTAPTTPRTPKTSSKRIVPRKSEKRITGGPASAFRGALSNCLGSRHASVDFTTSPRINHSNSMKSRGKTRELSQGPSSRSFLTGGFKKSSSFGGRTNLSSGGGGGGGGGGGSTSNFRSSSLSGSRVWR
eukprot:g8866.t1